MLSLRGFMTTQPREIGSISSDATMQQSHAQNSRHWYCRECGVQHAALLGTSAPEVFLTPQYLSKQEKKVFQQRKMLTRKSQKQVTSNSAQKDLSRSRMVNVLKAFAITALFWLIRFVKNVDISSSFST